MAETLMITASGEYIYFDAVLKVNHEAELTVTEHPIQNGASIADHSYMEPETVSLEVSSSDVMSTEEDHCISVYQRYKQLMYRREPVTLVTRLQTYTNMLLISVSTSDDYMTMHGLKASLGFKHIEVVTAATVSIQDKTTSSSSYGSYNSDESASLPAQTDTPVQEVESVQVNNNESILHGILGHQTAAQAIGSLWNGFWR